MEKARDMFPLLAAEKEGVQNANCDAGVTLAWQNLSVYVPIPRSTWDFLKRGDRKKPFKRVISNVSGIVHPGSFMAVLGSSGSGKSTLLSVLANRTPAGVVAEGDIMVNGVPTGKFMKKISGYVYQEDLFTGSLTVLEHLTFMGSLKLDRRLKDWERKRRVEELLIELGLKKCKDCRIGTPGQAGGISGGERKRLSFASEIISGCPLLYTDEPTTGLDSFSAQKIVSMMRDMAARGKTIICTIHQPNSQVFSMFDQLCLLSEGRIAYLGPARTDPAFMERIGFVLPKNHNPADFYIRLLAGASGKKGESRKDGHNVYEAYASSQEADDIHCEVQQEFEKSVAIDTLLEACGDYRKMGMREDTFKDFSTYPAVWWTQLYWLTWRSSLESIRNPRIHLFRTIQKIILAFLIAICFVGVNLDQQGIQNIQGIIFVFITESTFPQMYGVIHVFPHELPLFLRESKGGVYRVSTYYVGKIAAMMPGFIIEPLLFGSIAYWIIGLRPTAEAFSTIASVMIMTANTAAACGFFFSALFDNVSMSITALIPFDYMLMITGGIFLKLGTLPATLEWMKYLSWFMYANEAMSVTQWKNVTDIACDEDPTNPCLRSGADVLASRSFQESHFPWDFVGLISLYLVFHVGAYISLLARARR